MNHRYSNFEIVQYVVGWLKVGNYLHDVIDIKQMLENALAMLEDKELGIEESIKCKIKN